ncbi:SDR family oxidoreductase [Kordiimonas lacus]|uniref:Nucleoside-diphosphate-sugar epimerase n=1 Tax=Kordiimonas lacus TaxID=637679 RepID=A0A1G6TTI3_9PROT|nr:SDR family oxidoreductase [Kordiimonas lacus]SDD31756.1 Nucleoside-diphosphate-sugar epimerase [Kordiimonas lacus]
MSNNPHLLIFGPGFSARAIAKRAQEAGWDVSGTYRNPDKAAEIEALDITPVAFDANALADVLQAATHWLVSTAPDVDGDPVLNLLKSRADNQMPPKWIGYLSSTNVYGDHGGAWVDEDTPPTPSLDRGKRRVEAENSWRKRTGTLEATLHIFRLAGIYGPGRNAVRSLLDGKARRIVKPGQKFSRIHVADIAQTVWTAMNSTCPSGVFNLADDAPRPPQDIIMEAATAMGITPPPEIPLGQAEMSLMARSFYAESKLVRNERIKRDLGIKLIYPSFSDALPDLVKSEK